MKLIYNSFLFTIIFISFSCNQNQDLKQKELDLKEKELDLREKELNLNVKKDSLSNLYKENINLDSSEGKRIAKIESNDNSQEINKNNQEKNLNKILQEDFKNHNVSELPMIWSKRYDLLPNKYKSTVYTDNGSYNIKNNDVGVEELIRGFYWSCGNNEKMDQLGELISIDIGYNNPNLTYKSGMVFFYYKYEVINCIY